MLDLLLLFVLAQSPEGIANRATVVESEQTEYPTLKLPANVTGEAGRPIEIAGTTNGKAVYWFCQDDTRALRRLDDKTTLFTVPKPGRYRVWAWAVKGDRSTNATLVWVTVTPATDDPDNPGPVPPTPPTPPVPPSPPTPSDPLAKEIQEAYTADAGMAKASTLGKLVAFYEAVSAHVADKNTKTVGVFLEVYSEAAAKFLPEGELLGVRQAIGKRVGAVFPADVDSNIDEGTRAKAVSFFAQVVVALKAVK